ncbi:MAG: DUF29 domain-containing protein, partial [Beggiatoa sp.]|nr:DUF29 domain-containing protein [Beggiatoa sp.]
FQAWALENAALLRQGNVADIDMLHIAEELEGMSASERRELQSRLQVLMRHLLKYQYQPERRGKSWLLTIGHQRDAIDRLLKQSPSLRPLLDDAEEIADIYAKAVRDAVIETELDRHLFPSRCPYAIEQLLDGDFLPD